MNTPCAKTENVAAMFSSPSGSRIRSRSTSVTSMSSRSTQSPRAVLSLFHRSPGNFATNPTCSTPAAFSRSKTSMSS